MTTTDDPATFTPGGYWTPERARAAIAAMEATWNSPAMQALLGAPPDKLDFSDVPLSAPAVLVPPSAADVRVRRGRADDVPRLVELVAGAHLPPIFIAEWVDGFAIAEYEGGALACGGLEMYGGYGFIRSVVVEAAARGLGLGRHISELLLEDAKQSGASRVYLFTQDAYPFWLNLGFTDIDPGDWPEATRPCWQHRYVYRFWDFFRAAGVHSMYRPT